MSDDVYEARIELVGKYLLNPSAWPHGIDGPN